MRTTTLLLLASLGLPLPAVAQRAFGAPVARPGALEPVTKTDPARVAALLALADSASAAGRPGEARSIYESLVSDQRDAGQFAGKALWRLALNYLYAEKPYKAATLLDDLASDANKFGDPAAELRATFESAVLWVQLKRPELAMARIERTKALLQSPVIPDADKAAIKSRMQ